ncbi:MAG TPA: T9SS type A sorting domain-containing protein, partial [Chitinophagaceae bacterium]|nr:T9SS type A sorting domain-containing protein [Chitinophagaceae bacterium]
VVSPLTALQPNQVTTFYATATGTPASFAWYVNGQLIQTTTAPLLPYTGVDHLGDFTVRVTDANGCTSAASNVIAIKGDPSFEFWVYPVPNDGRFLVRFYAHTLGVKRTLRVWDAKGSRVFQKEFTMNSSYERMDVDISKYSPGVYYVELLDANGEQLGTSKVLVLK